MKQQETVQSPESKELLAYKKESLESSLDSLP